jgi:hypothetical protein
MHKSNEEKEEVVNPVGKPSSLDIVGLEKSTSLACSPLHLLPPKNHAHVRQMYLLSRSGP